MHGSFASVVRLLEHMGRLNSEVMTVIKTFALFRFAQSILSRCVSALRYFLGRRQQNSGNGAGLDEREFQDFARGAATRRGSSGGAVTQPHQQPPPGWRSLVVVFLVTFVGLPLVVSRLFSLLSARRDAMELEWEGSGEKGEMMVVALHDFEAESARELSFRAGDVLTVTNKFHPDWWEAFKNGRKGIIPSNYVTLADNDSGDNSSSNNFASDLDSGRSATRAATAE